jgi:hypothetical protein
MSEKGSSDKRIPALPYPNLLYLSQKMNKPENSLKKEEA